MAGANTIIIAAVVGLASVGGIYGIVQWNDDRSASTGDDLGQPVRDPLLLWPFLQGLADDGVSSSFVFVAVEPAASELTLPAGARWHSEAVGIIDVPVDAACQIEGEACPTVTRAPEGPRFGRDGYNATVAQIWAFDTQGRLFATNAPTGAADAYELHPQYTALPGGAWYLGDGEAPNGTTNFPMLKNQARALVNGLPEGGIATSVTDQFRWYMNDSLILTARIDGLVHAP